MISFIVGVFIVCFILFIYNYAKHGGFWKNLEHYTIVFTLTISIVILGTVLLRGILGLWVLESHIGEFSGEPEVEKLYSPDNKTWVRSDDDLYMYYVQNKDGTYQEAYVTRGETDLIYDPEATVGKLLTYTEKVVCIDEPKETWWHLDLSNCPEKFKNPAYRYKLIVPEDSVETIIVDEEE